MVGSPREVYYIGVYHYRNINLFDMVSESNNRYVIMHASKILPKYHHSRSNFSFVCHINEKYPSIDVDGVNSGPEKVQATRISVASLCS